jgi:hypothetical protein
MHVVDRLVLLILLTIADANGIFEFKDSEAKELALRFYRIEILRDQ